MKLRLVPSDRMIRKDGMVIFDCSQSLDRLPKNENGSEVHAVTWDGTKGEVEWVECGENLQLTELGIYAQISTDFDNEVAKLESEDKAANYSVQFRMARNSRLMESDWTVSSDSPLTAEKQAEWKTYRQALRDLPTTKSGSDRDLTLTQTHSEWPVQPS